MHKKKLVALLAAVTITQSSSLMAAGTIQNNIAPVKQDIDQVQSEKAEKNEYVTQSGKITEISRIQDNYGILVGTQEQGTVFILNSSKLIIDAKTQQFMLPEELREGMEVTVVVPKNVPATLSLPPMISGQSVVIVGASDVHIEEGFFDETLTNEENTLTLNIEKNTRILNTTGEKRRFSAEDIKEHNAVVIYTTSTKSIPAITTPQMVLILPSESDNYVSVREWAEEQGFEIKWDNKNKAVKLTKENQSILITVGKKAYTHNGENKTFTKEVKVENGKIYIPEEINQILNEGI